MSRTTEPISGFFVLVGMHFYSKSKYGNERLYFDFFFFFGKKKKNFGLSSAVETHVERATDILRSLEWIQQMHSCLRLSLVISGRKPFKKDLGKNASTDEKCKSDILLMPASF